MRVAYYEAIRELRKKSLIALLVLALLPIPLALLAKSLISPELLEALRSHSQLFGVKIGKMWAYMMGAAEPPPQAAAMLSLFGATSLIGLAWLAAILYGGDLVASDMRDGMIYYLFTRPLKRSDYILGKLLTVTALMEVLFVVAGLMTYAASWILFGPQEGVGEVILLSLLIGVGLLPLLLTSSAIGAATRNPLLGILLGFAAYFASAMIATLVAIAAMGGLTPSNIGRLMPVLYTATAVNPYTCYEMLVKGLYAVLEGENGIAYTIATPVGIVRRVMPLQPLETYAILSLILSITILVAVNWVLVARRDL